MSDSGGMVRGYLPFPAGKGVVLGNPNVTSASNTNGQMSLSPLYVPAVVTLKSLGFNVVAAGQAGATYVPVIYQDSGAGAPTNLLFAGTAVPADAVALSTAPCNFTLPVGWLWVGGLALNCATTAPTIHCTQQAGVLSPFGGLRLNGGGGAGEYIQGGLAAAPAVFTGSGGASFAPCPFGTT